uniref:Uncharacterized protein n=1 Tax=Tetranychus urticae TaxID=32264 RepID=T1K0E8_TETUR
METFIESPNFKRFHSYVKFFCVIGCAAQLLNATGNYLAFKVRNEVSFKYPDCIELPEIDISLPLASVLNISRLYERYPKQMAEVCSYLHEDDDQFDASKITADSYPILCSWVLKNARQSSNRIAEFITVKDIEELSFDARTQIHGLWIQHDNDNNVLNKYCSLKRFFSSNSFHIRISCLNNSKPLQIEAQNLFASGTSFISVGNMINAKYGFKLSSFNSNIEPNPIYYTTIPYREDGLVFSIIQYRKIVTSLLEYPYETNCIDYDRDSALADCINNRLLAMKPPSLYHAAVFPFGKYSGALPFINDQSKALPVYKACYETFRLPQCQKVEYETKQEILTDEVSQSYSVLVIQASKFPGTIYSSKSHQIFSEYIIFVGSILSMWFGVSIIDRLTISMVTGIKIYRQKVTPQTDTQVNTSPETEPAAE